MKGKTAEWWARVDLDALAHRTLLLPLQIQEAGTGVTKASMSWRKREAAFYCWAYSGLDDPVVSQSSAWDAHVW